MAVTHLDKSTQELNIEPCRCNQSARPPQVKTSQNVLWEILRFDRMYKLVQLHFSYDLLEKEKCISVKDPVMIETLQCVLAGCCSLCSMCLGQVWQHANPWLQGALDQAGLPRGRRGDEKRAPQALPHGHRPEHAQAVRVSPGERPPAPPAAVHRDGPPGRLAHAV